MKSSKLIVMVAAAFILMAVACIFVSCAQSGGRRKPQHQPTPATSGKEKPWSFIQIGDLHAGTVLYPSTWTNTVNTILTSNKAWNLKLLVSPGDCYEQETNFFAFVNDTSATRSTVNMTNDIWRLKAAGIACIMVPGNHDSDDDFHIGATNIIRWNDLFGTNFYANDPYHFTNRFPNDTRECAWKLTNGSTKFLFIGLRWIDNTNGVYNMFANTQEVWTAYGPSCNWASNVARQFPDHHVVTVMHYFVDTNGTPSTKDLTSDPDTIIGARGYVNEGPGIVAWHSLKAVPNAAMFLSGHVRARPMVKSTLKCTDGHPSESIKFNTQALSLTNLANGGAFVLYTVYPTEKYIHGQVYNVLLGRFMTNGEFSDRGFVNDWKFPLTGL